MKIFILTLFPNFINSFTEFSIIKKAIKNQHVFIKVVDIRKFTKYKHNQVDDTPYGGGSGMVLMVEPIIEAINSVKTNMSKVILLSPQGQIFDHEFAKQISIEKNDLIIICGHYEGFDERIRDYVDLEISIGDYVLTGGETAAMVITEAIVRLLPNVIKYDSHDNDSFNKGWLDYPVYTKPYDYQGKKVPDVLVNGNHKLINEWRHYEAVKNTILKRPDLLKKIQLSEEDKKIIQNIKKENKKI